MQDFLSISVGKIFFSYIVVFLYLFTAVNCSVLKLKLPHLNRTVRSSGFHRILQYNLSLQEVKGPTQILITQLMPKDIYLDPYQLLKRIEDNEIKIISERQINVEIPAYQAQPFSVQLCSISSTNFHKIELPFHLRYQKPHDCNINGESVLINLENLTIHFRTIKNYTPNLKCLSNNEIDNSWIKQMVEMSTIFKVPVGCMEHLYIVLSLTIGVTISAAIYLCSELLKVKLLNSL
ncbi:hypothetical protein CDAR_255871 [Caerostris darwini]|uniref:Phosphatidylinositol-glycan biosynthesis class X protein n=1 Tax=Caerostris darwini TaxID=1538125 RepID=A0AAV4WZS1_9ARAC|nr:hypothetical protein CDAR_255871 [Caerostris darwini]